MDKLERIFKFIWTRPIVREFLLLVATAVALQLAIDMGSLLSVLDTSLHPFTDISAWTISTASSVFLTAFRQSLVWAITKLGKVATSGRPDARAAGASPAAAVGLGSDQH